MTGPVYEQTWICVCTYRRNGLLAELLASLRAAGRQEDPPRVIVVDNSPEAGAEQTVREAYPEARYEHEPSRASPWRATRPSKPSRRTPRR